MQSVSGLRFGVVCLQLCGGTCCRICLLGSQGGPCTYFQARWVCALVLSVTGGCGSTIHSSPIPAPAALAQSIEGGIGLWALKTWPKSSPLLLAASL